MEPWTTQVWTVWVHFYLDFYSSSKYYNFPSGSGVKNLPANAGDMGLIPIQEDPTCQGAAKPMHHNYWACALGPGSRNCLRPMCPRAGTPRQEKPLWPEARGPQLESSPHSLQLKQSPRSMETQHSQKLKWINELIFKKDWCDISKSQGYWERVMFSLRTSTWNQPCG